MIQAGQWGGGQLGWQSPIRKTCVIALLLRQAASLFDVGVSTVIR
jgi:hypothetical protein